MPIDDSKQDPTVILTEKMATLGRMMAGIVHEINTPASAISAAGVNIVHHIQALLSTLVALDMRSVHEEAWPQILTLIQKMVTALDTEPRQRSVEMRNEQKRLSNILAQREIPEGEALARQLARMDLGDSVDEVLALAQICPLPKLLIVLKHCHHIVSSAQDLQISADMLLHDVRALKSYAHPGQERPELVDVHATLDIALTILKNQLKHRIQVDCHYEKLPYISGCAGELSHAWSNLLHNALQAIEGEGRILIETCVVDGNIGVKITDNGPGIPENVQPHIFESHFTTKAPGEGTGLGLALVKDIITKHQGTITVDSHPGQTTFEVHLPEK